jgi:uncharacterized membrane protein (DUF485 family)
MTPGDIARIQTDPRFRELERKRNQFSWTLAAIMLVAYYGFILLLAFAGHVVAAPFYGVITWAFPLGLGVIILAIVLTGIYVLRANGEFDALTRELVSGLAARRTTV